MIGIARRWGIGVGYGVCGLLVAAALTTSASAEDLRQRWYFGGNISFLSTTDDIRSNAAIIFTNNFGDDGIPFTGDPNELQGCGGTGQSFSNDPFCDPRPDDLLARDNTIEETFRLDLTAGYGLTSHVSLQLDASYFKGDVGPMDAFTRETFPSADPIDPSRLVRFRDREKDLPLRVGEITEIPVSLTGIVRFRKDSPMNPYIGIGAGIIFTEMDIDPEVGALNNRLAALRIVDVGNENGRSITKPSDAALAAAGNIPFRWPATVEVKDAFEWHVVSGAEYFFNDRFSMVFDARYTFADQEVVIDLGGEDQVDLISFSEELFRSDGSVQIYNPLGQAPNTLCSQAGPTADGCDPNSAGFNGRVRPTGTSANCPTQGDFDKNGQIDRCYGLNPGPSQSGQRAPRQVFVVQGGKIDLTGFSVAVGARFHF